ncbi:unnamed protein product [Sympodiomycopsis kandeliae]
MADDGRSVERSATHRIGSGLAVADLLSGPSPSRRTSNEETLDASESNDALPAKQTATGPSTPHKKSAGPVTQPLTPEAANDGLSYQYPPVQQIVEGRENIEYILHIREQPKHSRMCGVGEKADRRPIDPAPIIQLRVVTHPTPVSSKSAGIPPGAAQKDNHDRTQPTNVYQNTETNLPHLRRGEPVKTSLGDGWEDKAWYLENPYYFMCAMLADAEKDEELHLLSDGKTRYTTGSCVSCLYHLRDIDGSHQGFFVFPDLSIRVEGRYRLKLCLFETIGNQVHHCHSIYSDPFMVYTAKRFPGMEESTHLSRSFADQGLKVRVRKNTRGKKGRAVGQKSGPDDRTDGEDDGQRASGLDAAQKRIRSDSWLSTGSNSDFSAGQGLPHGMRAAPDPRQTYRPMSPQSPQTGWSGLPSSGANYIAHRNLDHYSHHNYSGGGPSRIAEDTTRGRSWSLIEERAFRSKGPNLPPLHAPRDSAWPPLARLPPSVEGERGQQQQQQPSFRPLHPPHPPPSAPHHSLCPPSQHPAYATGPGPPALSSRPQSPEIHWKTVHGRNASASRQRSFSSAASLAPRPWDNRPHGYILGLQRPNSNAGNSHASSSQHSPGSVSGAPSRPRSPSNGGPVQGGQYRSSLAFNPPRAGSHSNLPRTSSQLAGGAMSHHHSRERSLSDPRKLFRPPLSAWGSSLPPLPPSAPGSSSLRMGSDGNDVANASTLQRFEDPSRRSDAHYGGISSPSLPASRSFSGPHNEDTSMERHQHPVALGERDRAFRWQHDQSER